MPELPEVESARCLVERHCRGKRITSATAAADEKVIQGSTSAEVEAALLGRTVVAVHRRGKYFWWELDKGKHPLFHLGMAGGIIVRGETPAYYVNTKMDEENW